MGFDALSRKMTMATALPTTHPQVHLQSHTDETSYRLLCLTYSLHGLWLLYLVFLIYIILPWAKSLLRHTAITYNNTVL